MVNVEVLFVLSGETLFCEQLTCDTSIALWNEATCHICNLALSKEWQLVHYYIIQYGVLMYDFCKTCPGAHPDGNWMD